MNFKDFLLNEDTAFLAQKVGDILTASQELQSDAPNMGARELVRFSQNIVNQIRVILHSKWSQEQNSKLLELQKIAVAVAKCIDEKGDLKNLLDTTTQSLEKLSQDLGRPIHKFAVADKSPESDNKGTDKAVKNQKEANKTADKQPPVELPPDQSTIPASPQNMQQGGPATPPSSMSGNELNTPPLGGSSGPMDAF